MHVIRKNSIKNIHNFQRTECAILFAGHRSSLCVFKLSAIGSIAQYEICTFEKSAIQIDETIEDRNKSTSKRQRVGQIGRGRTSVFDTLINCTFEKESQGGQRDGAYVWCAWGAWGEVRGVRARVSASVCVCVRVSERACVVCVCVWECVRDERIHVRSRLKPSFW